MLNRGDIVGVVLGKLKKVSRKINIFNIFFLNNF